MGKEKNKIDLVTELQARNREMRGNLESLERQIAQFRSVVETAREAIISVNSKDEIIFWNKGAELMFGHSSSEMIGKSVTSVMPEHLREGHKKGLKRVIETGRSRVIGKTVELVGLRKDGTEFPVELSLAKWEAAGEIFFTAIIRDVAERKKAEEAFGEALSKAQQYLDVAGVIMVVIDPDQRVSLINRKGAKILGCSEKEVVGKNWFDSFLPQSIREEVRKAFAKLMAGKVAPVEYFENPVLNSQGEERIISWYNTLLKDDAGNILGTLSSGEDVTGKRESEAELERHRLHLEELVQERTKELEESEARYKKLIDSVTDFIYSVTVKEGQSVSTHHGPGCVAVTGYTPEDYQQNPNLWFDMICPDDRARVNENISKLLSGKETAPFEHRIIDREGRLRWIINTPVLRFDSKTGALLGYDGLIRDITKRREAEEDLLRSNRLLDAINRAQGGVISEEDPHTVFDELLADFLPLAESKFGFIAEQLKTDKGEPYLKLRALTNIAWNDETRALYRKFRSEGMEFTNMGTLFGAVVTSGKVVISNDPKSDPRSGGLPKGHPPLDSFIGIPYPLKGKMRGIVCAANRPGGYDEGMVDYLKPFLATCTSMVEAYDGKLKRLEAEEAVRRYAKELEESNRMKDLFTDIMRHDLLNPIHVMMNFAELLLDGETDGRKREIIEEIVSNTSSLAVLIENAAKYSKLHSTERIDLHRLDLNGMLKETVHKLMPEASRKRMELKYLRKRACIAPVNIILSDVFQNLLSNGVKYSPAGSKIEIGIKSEKKAWMVYFRDQGRGVADADKERIFLRFERAAGPGRHSGTGLGLAIAKRIVDLHDGRIWVEDNPGGGSLFCVSLLKEGACAGQKKGGE